MPSFKLPDLVNGEDVRVVEGRSSARFLLKAQHALAILSEFLRQQFERDLSPESRILGQVNLTHSARAEQRENPIMTDHLPCHSLVLILSDQLGRDLRGGRVKETFRLLVHRQQRLHLPAQFLIARTRSVEKGRALGGVAIQGGVIQTLDLLPSLRLHTNFLWLNLL